LQHPRCPALVHRRRHPSPIRTCAKLNSPAARVLELGVPLSIAIGNQCGERPMPIQWGRALPSAAGVIPMPCPARRAGKAAGVPTPRATVSSADPAPISRLLMVASISANRSSALRLKQIIRWAPSSPKAQPPDNATASIFSTPLTASRSALRGAGATAAHVHCCDRWPIEHHRG
jgi:hypothetical protein